jgi:DNA mismatch repair protein MutS2
MNDISPNTLDELGWHRILDAVAQRCLTEPGVTAVRAFRFRSDQDIATDLAQVSALMELIEHDGLLPIDGLEDVRESIGLCRRGGTGTVEGLYAVAKSARCLTRTRRRLSYHAEERRALAPLYEQMPDVSEVDACLRGLFDASGELRDDASPALAEACARRTTHLQRLKVRLDKYLQRDDIQDLAQDLYYTQRDDRFVIPVIASFQSKVPGIIHGTSSSGETVYIEPEHFVAGNNDLKLAEAEVRARRQEVLRDASLDVAARGDELMGAFDAGVRLDALQGRARFGIEMDAVVPRFAHSDDLVLNEAANPMLLLRGLDVVRNDITLEGTARFVVITGPNTGGKTVTLSTAGLLVLMTHAAIPIPVVMESLAERGARGFVTTHYTRLKTLAYENDSFANASVGVEADSLTPSYELMMGLPGASNPFAVATHLGFDERVIERAQAIFAGDAEFAVAIERLEQERVRLADRTEELKRAASQSEALKERYETRIAAMEARREVAKREMQAEVRQEAENALEAIRRQVREVQAERDPRALEQKRKRLEVLREDAERLSAEPVPEADRAPQDQGDFVQPPSPGDPVWARPLGQAGRVVDVRDGSVTLMVGSMRMSLKLRELGKMAGSPSPSPSRRTEGSSTQEERRPNTLPVPQSSTNSIDLRGVRRDEVELPLLAFLDQSFRAGQRNVWIIHGIGTGAIREETRSLLTRVPYVDSFRSGERHEGGDGATIVWLSERA